MGDSGRSWFGSSKSEKACRDGELAQQPSLREELELVTRPWGQERQHQVALIGCPLEGDRKWTLGSGGKMPEWATKKGRVVAQD